MAVIVRHIEYAPQYQQLSQICAEMEKDGFSLLRVVKTAFLPIAVFEAASSPTSTIESSTQP